MHPSPLQRLSDPNPHTLPLGRIDKVPDLPAHERVRGVASDFFFIAGEAKSHCVLETIEDLVEEFADQPEILQRIYVLEDRTSSICHPEIDYETVTRNRFAEFVRKGIHVVKSTDPFPPAAFLFRHRRRHSSSISGSVGRTSKNEHDYGAEDLSDASVPVISLR